MSAKFKKYLDKFEIKNRIRIHDFRHSNISFLINLGVNVFQIAKRVGHTNPKQIFKTYGHLYPDKEQEVIDKINNCCHNVATGKNNG
ncbi:hypothetical protein AZF37_02245 [endosymbiont 'TC1' of Trimyema compressum]|nr:hypothetical protein AZF37_02245 [endosymbiont 'TC1' of Trimyema compressum]